MKSSESLYPNDIESSRTDQIFDRFGPTPRICIEYQMDREEMRNYEKAVNEAISRITSTQLDKLLKDGKDLSIDSVSHKISLLSRESSDDISSDTTIAPITSIIQSRLAVQIRNMELAEQLRLYQYFSSVPAGRKIAGVFFEALAQKLFQINIDIELIPMVKLEKPSSRWNSSHEHLSKNLEPLRQNALSRRFHKSATPLETREYKDHNGLKIEKDIFYIPAAANEEAFDSFIVLDNDLFIFQFTISHVHDIKPGFIEFFGKCKPESVPRKENWKLVFVIAPNMILKSPNLKNLPDLKLFSTVVSDDKLVGVV